MTELPGSPLEDGSTRADSHELLPDGPVSDTKTWRFHRSIPRQLSEFALYPNVDEWCPGDLLLIRHLKPDHLSHCIRYLQVKAGYPSHAFWTHAAIYVGDGWRICEAKVQAAPLPQGDVRLTALWDYCNNKTVLKVRRPKVSRDAAWLIVVEAVSQIRQRYDVKGTLKLVAEIVLSSKHWAGVNAAEVATPLVCSTLYADAYSRVTSRLLGERNGMCLPALLGKSNQFTDVPLYWRRIAS